MYLMTRQNIKSFSIFFWLVTATVLDPKTARSNDAKQACCSAVGKRGNLPMLPGVAAMGDCADLSRTALDGLPYCRGSVAKFVNPDSVMQRCFMSRCTTSQCSKPAMIAPRCAASLPLARSIPFEQTCQLEISINVFVQIVDCSCTIKQDSPKDRLAINSAATKSSQH
eukprot:310817-Amphidinium_carterae.1